MQRFFEDVLIGETPSIGNFILTTSIIFTIVIGSLIYVSWRKYKQSKQSKKVDKNDKFD